MGNSFGTLFKLTTFGESHGAAIGGIIDGCPANLLLDVETIQKALDRRKPGQSHITTQRKESDRVEILSGIFEGRTLGTPIGFIIRNEDQQSKDYSHLKNQYRPSHADFTWDARFGHRDYRGGGRSSARETACRVVAGAVAAQVLKHVGVETRAWVERVQNVSMPNWKEEDLPSIDEIEANIVRCPNPDVAEQMIELIETTRKSGDTVGGAIRCMASGVPAGWGAPVFDKLHADLAKAMFSINAVKAVEVGSGTAGSYRRGSEENDPFDLHDGKIVTTSNNSGGIQGGLSNGNIIDFGIVFKPVATIMRDQSSVDRLGQQSIVKGKGRHDPCVLPRAVPIVEAMMAIVLVDHMLLSRTVRLDG